MNAPLSRAWRSEVRRTDDAATGHGMIRSAVHLILACLLLAGVSGRLSAAEPAPLGSWRDVVERTPFSESQGVYANLTTIRRWVLTGQSFCEQPDRHILYDHRMRFLGYLSDTGSREENQREINTQRQRLALENKVVGWAPGDEDQAGYPFALSCDHPDAFLPRLVARYTGEDPSARLWGTWDGLRVGSEAQPVSLHVAIRAVFEQRRAEGRIDLPEQTLAALAGKVIIESGGVREARSTAGAVGIMQLTPEAMDDCRLEASFRLHRLAQIDCALYLLQQNHRNLAPAFDETFGALPVAKAGRLYQMLLVQAYHTGVGRVRSLLLDDALNQPARYFADHGEPFSAGDIALGMIFHNLGREELGFATLYYVADVSIAAAEICGQVSDLPGCMPD